MGSSKAADQRPGEKLLHTRSLSPLLFALFTGRPRETSSRPTRVSFLSPPVRPLSPFVTRQRIHFISPSGQPSLREKHRERSQRYATFFSFFRFLHLLISFSFFPPLSLFFLLGIVTLERRVPRKSYVFRGFFDWYSGNTL